MQYPSYVFAETLRDGTVVTVRAAGANDGPRIRRAFLNLERDTVYTRFFGYKAEVSDAELGRITGADFERAVALLVTIGAGEDEVVIGGASYFVSGSVAAAGRSAELAFTVEEDFQSRGIGSLLMRPRGVLPVAISTVRRRRDEGGAGDLVGSAWRPGGTRARPKAGGFR